MYCTIYKITNNVNGKIYIGMHRTTSLNDGYMGSGTLLKRAQEKYGIEHFSKEILYVFDTIEEMHAKERELVNEQFITDPHTYNILLGGLGDPKDFKEFDYYKSGNHTKNAAVARSKARKRNQELKAERHAKYYANPKYCNNCGNVLDFYKRSNKFCSSSCSASSNNSSRKISEEHKTNTSKALRLYYGDTENSKKLKQRKRNKVKKEQHINDIKQVILDMSLDYTKRGWVTQLSIATNIRRNEVKKWLQKHMPEIYEMAYL